MNFVRRWIADKLEGRCYSLWLKDLSNHDIAAIKDELRTALSEIEDAEEAEDAGLPCKADDRMMLALHRIRAMTGQRVKPAPYEHYSRKIPLIHYLFGYRAPASPRTVKYSETVRYNAHRGEGYYV